MLIKAENKNKKQRIPSTFCSNRKVNEFWNEDQREKYKEFVKKMVHQIKKKSDKRNQ
jgi:hypothetical protein